MGNKFSLMKAYKMDGSNLSEEQKTSAVQSRIDYYDKLIEEIKSKGYTPGEHTIAHAAETEFTGIDEMWFEKKERFKWFKEKMYYPLWRLFNDTIFNKGTYKRLWQRITRGWDDSDTWSLDYTMSKFILPRMKRLKWFIQNHDMGGYPSGISYEEWIMILNRIIWSLEFHLYDNNKSCSQEDWDRHQEGIELLGKWYGNFWW